MLNNVFKRLRTAGDRMGVRNPENYVFTMTVAEALELSSEIDRLLREIQELKTRTPPPGYALVKLEDADERVARALAVGSNDYYFEKTGKLSTGFMRAAQAAIKAMTEEKS